MQLLTQCWNPYLPHLLVGLKPRLTLISNLGVGNKDSSTGGSFGVKLLLSKNNFLEVYLVKQLRGKDDIENSPVYFNSSQNEWI
jgi:hypothetical protein